MVLPLVLCILDITLVLSIGYLFQRVLQKLTDRNLRDYLTELISTCEYSTCVFELGVFDRMYGFNSALLAAFCVLVVKNYNILFRGRAINPCGAVEYLFTSSRRRYVLKLWLTQVSGAFLSYFYVMLIWRLSQSYHHLQHLHHDENPPLKIGIILAFIIEFSATFSCNFVEYATRKNGYDFVNSCLNAATCVTAAYLLAGTTRVWMNPALATAHLFQLEVNLLQNILVYWLAPIAGASLAYQCRNYIVNVLQPVTRKDL